MNDAAPVAMLGLDIGGANIKAYHTAGIALSVPFAMWLRPDDLAVQLQQLAKSLPVAQRWLITMTGEMADIFFDRSEGVERIVQQVQAAADLHQVQHCHYYSTNGVFVNANLAITTPTAIASANWHALAQWAATWADRPSLLIDIGTTTTDLIPISPDCVNTSSKTDYDRLVRHELVYLGIRRTPVAMLVDQLPCDGQMVSIMRERFADMGDVAMLLGHASEAADDFDTCDGRPRQMLFAQNRLARMIGKSASEITTAQAHDMARYVQSQAMARISHAVSHHGSHARTQWIVSGHAACLLCPDAEINVIDLTQRLGPDIARVGPAYALCQLVQNKPLLLSECND